jgi:uncharacterized protein (TIGR03083 family)
MSPDQIVPERLPVLVEAFAQTAQAVVDLARACSDDDLAQPTDCPGWTVHDQISHVAGVERALALPGHKDPRVEMPPYDHVRNDLGKKVEYAVEVRRGRSGAQVLAELEEVLAQRLSTLRDPGLTDTSIIAGPFGPDQATTVLLLRVFDVWTHEQDIRSALGRPGDLDSPAAAVVVSTVMAQAPKVLARAAAVEPGQLVVIDVTGPDPAVTASQGVRVERDAMGKARGRAIPAGEQGAAGSDAHSFAAQTDLPVPEDRTTTISLSTEAFTRRAAGRRAVSDTAYDVVGDVAVARRVLEALVVTH